MKVAILNNGSLVNQHFGRSTSFIITTIEKNTVRNIKEMDTKGYTHQHGKLSALLSESGVETVIAGGIGSGASSALEDKGIKIIKGAQGEYKDALEQFAKGQLESRDITCVHSHGHHHDHHHN